MADGLAGTDVQAITSDSQDRTWLGTKTGLSIWTGATFFNLTSENGLPSDDITALQADDDVVWIGTRDGGLLRFQDNQLQVFNSANADLPSDTITVLAIHSDGSMLLGTDRGLARFSDNQLIPIEELGDIDIRALATTPGGEIWIASSENQLYQFDGTDWIEFTDSDEMPSSPITALLVDKTGALWIGSEQGGLVRYIP
jgi:ligand-binding sensor domain-containing protein